VPWRPINLADRTFGSWTVIRFDDESPRGGGAKAHWICGTSLRKGASSSCGCQQKSRITEAKLEVRAEIKQPSPIQNAFAIHHVGEFAVTNFPWETVAP